MGWDGGYLAAVHDLVDLVDEDDAVPLRVPERIHHDVVVRLELVRLVVLNQRPRVADAHALLLGAVSLAGSLRARAQKIVPGHRLSAARGVKDALKYERHVAVHGVKLCAVDLAHWGERTHAAAAVGPSVRSMGHAADKIAVDFHVHVIKVAVAVQGPELLARRIARSPRAWPTLGSLRRLLRSTPGGFHSRILTAPLPAVHIECERLGTIAFVSAIRISFFHRPLLLFVIGLVGGVANEEVEDALLHLALDERRFRLADALLAEENAVLNEIPDNLIDVLPVEANLCEFGCLHFHEWGAHKLRQPARNLRLAAAGWPNHQDILWHNFIPHALRHHTVPPPSVPERHGHRPLRGLLAHDEIIEPGHHLSRREVVLKAVCGRRR